MALLRLFNKEEEENLFIRYKKIVSRSFFTIFAKKERDYELKETINIGATFNCGRSNIKNLD